MKKKPREPLLYLYRRHHTSLDSLDAVDCCLSHSPIISPDSKIESGNSIAKNENNMKKNHHSRFVMPNFQMISSKKKKGNFLIVHSPQSPRLEQPPLPFVSGQHHESNLYHHFPSQETTSTQTEEVEDHYHAFYPVEDKSIQTTAVTCENNLIKVDDSNCGNQSRDEETMIIAKQQENSTSPPNSDAHEPPATTTIPTTIPTTWEEMIARRLIQGGRKCWSLMLRRGGRSRSLIDLYTENDAMSISRHGEEEETDGQVDLIHRKEQETEQLEVELIGDVDNSQVNPSSNNELLCEMRSVQRQNRVIQDMLADISATVERLSNLKATNDNGNHSSGSDESVSYLLTRILQGQKEREREMEERLQLVTKERDRLARQLNDLTERLTTIMDNGALQAGEDICDDSLCEYMRALH